MYSDSITVSSDRQLDPTALAVAGYGLAAVLVDPRHELAFPDEEAMEVGPARHQGLRDPTVRSVGLGDRAAEPTFVMTTNLRSSAWRIWSRVCPIRLSRGQGGDWAAIIGCRNWPRRPLAATKEDGPRRT